MENKQELISDQHNATDLSLPPETTSPERSESKDNIHNNPNDSIIAVRARELRVKVFGVGADNKGRIFVRYKGRRTARTFQFQFHSAFQVVGNGFE